MGTFSVKMTVVNPHRTHRSHSFEGIVDTGALFSQLPAGAVRPLGLKVRGRREFRLANGKRVRRKLVDVLIRYDGVEAYTQAVVGEKGAPVLWGATTLETLGVKPDPVRQVLEHTTLHLLTLGPSAAASRGRPDGTTPMKLRDLPSVDALLTSPRATDLAREHGRPLVADSIRLVLDRLRRQLKDGKMGDGVTTATILDGVAQEVGARRRLHLRRVVNATGVILHTGLGRAVLAPSVLEALAREHRGYSLLEVDAATGERGEREATVSARLAELTGAEAATVVNNNAGATLLALAALAQGREVIVSRGQLVEIGGSFRLPEVMATSGARLREVGTTNRTRLADYERAITPETALLLRVHTSNYRVVGFTESVTIEDLVALGKKRGLPVMDDLGSGAMADLSAWGLRDEPLVRDSTGAGADVVCFSGDKLLGGPQAGILVGKRDVVRKIRSHPLFRALRPDKLTLTALEATLLLYLNPDRLAEDHPTLRMIALPREELDRRAQSLAAALQGLKGLAVEVLDDSSEVGGGSLPGQQLPTRVVALRHKRHGPDELAARLRRHEPPAFARVQRDRLLLDVRTLLDGDEADIVSAIRAAAE